MRTKDLAALATIAGGQFNEDEDHEGVESHPWMAQHGTTSVGFGCPVLKCYEITTSECLWFYVCFGVSKANHSLMVLKCLDYVGFLQPTMLPGFQSTSWWSMILAVSTWCNTPALNHRYAMHMDCPTKNGAFFGFNQDSDSQIKHSQSTEGPLLSWKCASFPMTQHRWRPWLPPPFHIPISRCLWPAGTPKQRQLWRSQAGDFARGTTTTMDHVD